MSLEASVDGVFRAKGAEPFDLTAELSVESGETLAILGPSGSGKTLVLETVAGLHDAEERTVLCDREVTGVPPEERGMGFVFQDHALFPNMTVEENVEFGDRYHGGTMDTEELLESLDIAGLRERYPARLSGGERQRVGLARALYIDPETLLLDEPLASLDRPAKESLAVDLKSVLEDRTAIYVTHDRELARRLGDRLAVFRDGEVEQIGGTEEVFESPETEFVAEFTGSNVLPGRLSGSGSRVAVRPEDLNLCGDGGLSVNEEELPYFDAEVVGSERVGGGFLVWLESDGCEVKAYAGEPPEPGETVSVEVSEATELPAGN